MEEVPTSLRDEIVRIFQNPSDDSDDPLFIKVPLSKQRHNNLSPLSSPVFLPTDLPSSPCSHIESLIPSFQSVRISEPTKPQSNHLSSEESPIPNFSVPIAPESPELFNQPIQLLTFVPTKSKPTMAGTQEQPSIATQQQPPPIIVSIPMRGERGAPTVDINKPRMLIRFFKELEMIFTKAGVTAEAGVVATRLFQMGWVIPVSQCA